MTAGKDGSYGTSVERYKALDLASDIILAFKQNGRLLTPDHGYPLRIIIPGAFIVILCEAFAILTAITGILQVPLMLLCVKVSNGFCMCALSTSLL